MEWIKWAKEEATVFCKDLTQELSEIDTVLHDMIMNGQDASGFDGNFVLTSRESSEEYRECLKAETMCDYSAQRTLLLQNDVNMKRVYEETVGAGMVEAAVFWAQWRFYQRHVLVTGDVQPPDTRHEIALDDWE